MEQDIGEMERMIDSLLAYLSGDIDDPTEPVAPTDIAVMCATAADEASDRGHRVRYAGPDHLVLPVHGIAIKRSEEHTSELQSLMRISYAVFCLKKKKNQ